MEDFALRIGMGINWRAPGAGFFFRGRLGGSFSAGLWCIGISGKPFFQYGISMVVSLGMAGLAFLGRAVNVRMYLPDQLAVFCFDFPLPGIGRKL